MDAVQEVPQIPMNAPSDMVIFYRTLVADGGLPPGYEREFYTLGPVLESVAQRRDERSRWVEVLGATLVHTPTPVVKIFGDKPGSIQLLGAGRRASTLRSRVRAVRRYHIWLALNHDVGYPRELEHATGYLHARQSEPCTRNALWGAIRRLHLWKRLLGLNHHPSLRHHKCTRPSKKKCLPTRFQGNLRSKHQGCWW